MNDLLDRSRRLLHLTWQQTRRAVIAVVGASILLVGVVMIVAPGPAFLVIPAGLAILAIEFVWARRLLRQIKIRARRVARRTSRSSTAPQSRPGWLAVLSRRAPLPDTGGTSPSA